MADVGIDQIKKAIIKRFEEQATGEEIYSKVFSLYILDKYATLLWKIYQKVEKKG
jgi:hypothetical protein